MPSLDLHAADPGLIAAIARHFVAVGDFGAAEEALSAAPLSTSAAFAAVLVELAAAAARTDTAIAQRALARASESMTTSAPYWRAAAAVAAELGEIEHARAALEKAVGLDEADPKTWMALAKASERMGDHLRAAKAYISAVESAGPSATVLTVAERLRKLKVNEGEPVRMAFVGSSTLEQLRDYVEVGCRAAGLAPEVYVAPFGQFAEEILNAKSGLYSFGAEVIILSVSAQALFPDFYDGLWKEELAERTGAVNEIVERASGLLRGLTSRTNALVLMDTFPTPRFAPLGLLDRREELGLAEFYPLVNALVARRVREEFPTVLLIDLDRIVSDVGKRNATDARMWYVAKVAHSHAAMGALSSAYVGAIKGLKGRSRKCIVLDLDNTLWGGVIGEDGLAGIQLGGDGAGGAFRTFQTSLLQLWERGVLLAVNSKNTHEDAMAALESHPEMVLRPSHFAALRINWQDKASNLKSIAEELNIGLDSLVFMDDSPAECALVRAALPEVRTVCLPSDPSLYRGILLDLNDFTSLNLTDEDRMRGRLYSERRERETWEGDRAENLTEHLAQLGIVVTVSLANEFTIPRITQLIGKTNQFNLTTPRYTEAQVRAFAASDSHGVFSVSVRDRFGEHGLVGTAIVEIGDEAHRVDTFLLSCRVLGRGVETALLSEIARRARSQGAKMLKAVFAPTLKNEPARQFLPGHGFAQDPNDTSQQVWLRLLDDAAVVCPDWITLESQLP